MQGPPGLRVVIDWPGVGVDSHARARAALTRVTRGEGGTTHRRRAPPACLVVQLCVAHTHTPSPQPRKPPPTNQTARRAVVARVAAPIKEEWVANLHAGEHVDDRDGAASRVLPPVPPAPPRPSTLNPPPKKTPQKTPPTTVKDTESAAEAALPRRITHEGICALEAELDAGEGVAALRRFNDALRAVPSDRWRSALDPLFNELCFNLESFNPAFAACVLQVQRTIGQSDYVRRDVALKNLIQPLAGEYGMHNGLPQR